MKTEKFHDVLRNPEYIRKGTKFYNSIIDNSENLAEKIKSNVIPNFGDFQLKDIYHSSLRFTVKCNPSMEEIKEAAREYFPKEFNFRMISVSDDFFMVNKLFPDGITYTLFSAGRDEESPLFFELYNERAGGILMKLAKDLNFQFSKYPIYKKEISDAEAPT